MKYVAPPGKIWQHRRHLGRVKSANIVQYPYPGRPHLFYARRYVVPRNPRTPAQVHPRQLFGALARDWLGLLTPPQRDAWTAFARNYSRRWGAAWLDYARQLNYCWPQALTPFHRRLIRRLLVAGRPLSGPQAYVKFNSRLGRMGRPKLLWPPPPVSFRPNPVQAVRLRWETVTADVSRPHLIPNPNLNPNLNRNPNPNPIPADVRLRLELVLKRPLKCDLLLFGSAPCSAGWSTMRRPVYLGLLPAPREGVHDITALYLARFRAPTPNEQIFIRSCQHRHGWESVPQDHSARVPSKPAPLPPPSPNDPLPIPNPQFSIGPRPSILHPLSSILAGRGPAALCPCVTPLPPRRLGLHPSWTPSLLPLGTHWVHPPCTRGVYFRRASATANVRQRSFLACHRRKFRCRELWRGT